MVAARGQDILANLPCLFCGCRLPHHFEHCPLYHGILGFPFEPKEAKMNKDVEEPKPENPEAVNHHLTDSELKRYCDNARAYGWEAGRAYGLASSVDKDIPNLEPVYNSHPSNPFVQPDWDKDLKRPQGFMVTATENQL